MFVGDGVEDILLIQPQKNGEVKRKVLANHNTTWHYQRSHCHPTFSWDGKMLLYAADRDRWNDNLFLVEVPETI